MRRLLCVAALAITDAAAKFALEKKGQKVLNVKLYETGYTFTNRGDKAKKPQTLREISGCSFGKKRDNGRRELCSSAPRLPGSRTAAATRRARRSSRSGRACPLACS